MPISEDPELAKAAGGDKAAASAPDAPEPASEEGLNKQLDIVLNGTGVDLKAVKGPRLALLSKQEAKAQKEALDKFAASALALGPRPTLLKGNLPELVALGLGKKKGKNDNTRVQALAALEGVAWATPLLIPEPLQALIALHGDAKMGAASLATASAIISKFTPKGHGVVQLVLPSLMAMVDDKNWKVRVVGMKLLPSCLTQMHHTTKQLSELLSRLLPQLLAGPLMEPRKEIQEAARGVLEVIAKEVRNSEVSTMSEDIVRAVADPANQKYTQDVLAKLGSTTFMNYIDAASLALLIPIMARGLKEREQKSRKWSAQILGAIVTLVRDIDYLRPYLPTLLPMLKECAVDPTYEIQREAAKAFGMLTQELPDWSRRELQPWLCVELCSKDVGIALGCAHAFSQVLLRLGKQHRSKYMHAIIVGARSPCADERRGFLFLLDFLLDALKNDFVPYIRSAFPAMLAGILPEPDDPGMRASQALVGRFAAACPELLLQGWEDLFFAAAYDKFVFPTALKHAGSYLPHQQHWVMREIYLKLLLQLCDKILEYRKFGQDMLTCEDCSSRKVREQIMVLLEVLKEDKNAQVQRQAKHIWRQCGGQPKVTKEIMPTLEAKLLQMHADPKCVQKRKYADSLLASLAQEGEIGSGDAEAYLAALPKAPEVEPPHADTEKGAGFHHLQQVLGMEEPSDAAPAPSDDEVEEEEEAAPEEEHLVSHEKDRVALARAAFEATFAPGAWDAAGEGAEAARAFCETVAASVAVEALSSRGLYGELKLKLQTITHQYAAEAVTDDGVAKVARNVAVAVFGEDSLSQEDELEAEEVVGDRLLHVDDLMLMYGGGHLLLKDTVLDVRKNRRYGIIGHNGCGKTTLMKELQAGRVSGMPKELRCVHVSDADLGNMKVLEMNAAAFVEKEMPKDATLTVEEALVKVGFPRDMQEKNVADLSGGWRMRLLLASAMMKQADILLLDEPTNHLDVHAIEWLCQYLLSVKTGALMVISHDPHFLNAVCTDIIQYRDKKLVYYKGNFDAFKQANAISDDDAEILLAGNLSLDRERAAKATEAAPAAGGEAGAGASDAKDEAAVEQAAVDAIADEPKAAPVKLVFPIPGKLEGIRNNTKPVMEIKDVFFEYFGGKGLVIKGVTARLNLGSRVAFVGRNGAGKSTLLGLMCGELQPTEHEGKVGEVWQHHNLRLSFIAQHHMTSLGKWYESTPFTYLSYRFQNGWDEEMQKHLIEPKDEDEKKERKEKAARHGKYGKQVGAVVGRSMQHGKLAYEVQWEGMTDPKQHTFEPLDKLRDLGVEGMASACNLRIAASTLESRACSRREIVKHLEQFGMDEEMCCNRLIGGFSAGQKSKLALACATWTKPHVLALDEPTNYLDQETVESLARALKNFRGGVVVVTHSRDFIEKVCTEEWLVEDGKVAVGKVDSKA